MSEPVDPPAYRQGTVTEHCGNCLMHFHGRCWGYGNLPVQADHVCDSWSPERDQPGLSQDES